MESSINGRWVFPFKKFNMIRVKSLLQFNQLKAFLGIKINIKSASNNLLANIKNLETEIYKHFHLSPKGIFAHDQTAMHSVA